MNPSTNSAGTLARVLCNRVGKWVAAALWVVALADIGRATPQPSLAPGAP